MKKKEKYKDREEQFEDATAEVEAYHSGINASAQVCFLTLIFIQGGIRFAFKEAKYRKYNNKIRFDE